MGTEYKEDARCSLERAFLHPDEGLSTMLTAVRVVSAYLALKDDFFIGMYSHRVTFNHDQASISRINTHSDGPNMTFCPRAFERLTYRTRERTPEIHFFQRSHST